METKERRLTRQAYLDNQLPVEDVIAFEESLKGEERLQVERERAFEEALSQRLREEAPCPVAVWEHLQERMNGKRGRQPWAVPFANGWKGLAIAAGIALLAAGFFVWNPLGSVDSTEQLKSGALPVSVGQCGGLAEIPGDYVKVVSALTANRIFLNMKPCDEISEGHPIKLLGMRMLNQGDKAVAQVFFECCGQPISVFITPLSNPWAASELPMKDVKGDWFVRQRELDQYRIIGVGTHDPSEVLALFS